MLSDRLSSTPWPNSPASNAIGAKEIAQLRSEFHHEGIGELVEMFREEWRLIFEHMAAATEHGDATAVRRAAHALRGACTNFGAANLESVCEQIEKSARSGNLAQASALLPPATAEYRRVERALLQECQTELES